MTEVEWAECSDPLSLVAFVRRDVVTLVDEVPAERQEAMRRHLLSLVSPRKLRLVACAACRRLWPLLGDERSRKAVEVAERYIDGLAGYPEWAAAGGGAVMAWEAAMAKPGYAGGHAARTCRAAANAAMRTACFDLERAIDECAVAVAWASDSLTLHDAREEQAQLLRDVVGNPFRPVVIEPGCRTAKLVALAQAAYDHCLLPEGHLDPAHLSALAAALEAVGCEDAELLGHLRGPGPHWRGRWAVDALTGKS
jgi:hypothetical protein